MTDNQPEADAVNRLHILIVYFIFKPFLSKKTTLKFLRIFTIYQEKPNKLVIL
jgi:hypothetical protein